MLPQPHFAFPLPARSLTTSLPLPTIQLPILVGVGIWLVVGGWHWPYCWHDDPLHRRNMLCVVFAIVHTLISLTVVVLGLGHKLHWAISYIKSMYPDFNSRSAHVQINCDAYLNSFNVFVWEGGSGGIETFISPGRISIELCCFCLTSWPREGRSFTNQKISVIYSYNVNISHSLFTMYSTVII